jgi:hypothetical protein
MALTAISVRSNISCNGLLYSEIEYVRRIAILQIPLIFNDKEGKNAQAEICFVFRQSHDGGLPGRGSRFQCGGICCGTKGSDPFYNMGQKGLTLFIIHMLLYANQ